MKYFKIDICDSYTSVETVYTFELANPVSSSFFSDADVILDSSADSSEKKTIYPLLRLPENIQSLMVLDPLYKHQVILKNLLLPLKINNFSVAAQQPPLSPIPVAPAVTTTIILRPILFPDPFDIDPTPAPLSPPPWTKTLAKKTICSKHRTRFDATNSSYDEPTTSVLQKKVDEP